jgi:CubicO group peptidase (beta-lactamase class C family)
MCSPWRKRALLWALLGVSGPASAADALPLSSPQALGLSRERLAYIDSFYSAQVKSGAMAGMVLLIARHGKIAHFEAIGYADRESGRKMQPNTIFRLYSMTKPLVATALLMLYEQGRFRLSEPVSNYIPEFAHLRVLRKPDGPVNDTVSLDRPITMEDILRHTSGYTGADKDSYGALYTAADYDGLELSPADLMTKLATIPLRYQPGKEWHYSIAPDIQVRLVEILTGRPFDTFFHEAVLEPLGMKDTDYWTPPAKADRLATVYWMNNGALTPLDAVHGYPPGDAGYAPSSVNSYKEHHRRTGGSAGLVGTAVDYWRFGQMLLNGGELDGVRLLSKDVVTLMTSDHLHGINVDDYLSPWGGFGLGLGIVKDPNAEHLLTSAGTYFWDGGAATVWWADPKSDMVVVAMTQFMGSGPEAVGNLREQLHTLVSGAIEN